MPENGHAFDADFERPGFQPAFPKSETIKEYDRTDVRQRGMTRCVMPVKDISCLLFGNDI